MVGHKFRVGQLARLVRDPSMRVSGIYEVRACLPPDAEGHFLYRVKGAHENHERMVKEYEIVRAVRPSA